MPRVVVSLSVVPKRFRYLDDILRRVVQNQTVKPDKVYVNACTKLARTGSRLSISSGSLEVVRKHKGLVVLNRCEDLGPITKLLPTLEQETDPDTLLVVVDDDIDFPPGLVEQLVSRQQASDGRTCFGACGFHWVDPPDPGETGYSTQIVPEYEDGREVDVIEGYGTYIVRRGWFDDSFFRLFRFSGLSAETFKSSGPFKSLVMADDVVVSKYLRSKGVRLEIVSTTGLNRKLIKPLAYGYTEDALQFNQQTGSNLANYIVVYDWMDAILANGRVDESDFNPDEDDPKASKPAAEQEASDEPKQPDCGVPEGSTCLVESVQRALRQAGEGASVGWQRLLNECLPLQKQISAWSACPKVTILTPTQNRADLFPRLIRAVENQTYRNFEWLICEDGDHDVSSLVSHLPYVRYVRLPKKVPIGEKRNIMNARIKGEIAVCFDDDDYHFPDRVEHSVDTLIHSSLMIAGCSRALLYIDGGFWQTRLGIKFHATNGTFAFKTELTKTRQYDRTKARAEESSFLNRFNLPLAQLDPFRNILVMSHAGNTVNKSAWLKKSRNIVHRFSNLTLDKLIPDPELRQMYA